MTEYVIRGATDDDAHILAPIMRDLDREEVWASLAVSPLEALQRGLDSATEAFTALADGVPFCMFGISPYTYMGGVGTPWLLTAQDITDHRKQLMRWSKPVAVHWCQNMYPTLLNMIDARHRPGLAWAKRVGFQVSEKPQAFGPFKMPFHRIIMRRE